MAKSVKVVCVFRGGVFDQDATLAAAEAQIAALGAEHEERFAAVASAIDETLSAPGLKSVNMAYLVSQVCIRLGTNAEDFSKVREATEEWVKVNSDEEDDFRLFDCKRGRGGGVSLHIPPVPPELAPSTPTE
jgi:hypothetical protein